MAELTYLLPVSDTISEAWRKVKGTKATVWAAMGLLVIIWVGFEIIRYLIQQVIPPMTSIWDLITHFVLLLMEWSMIYIGIQRAQDFPISYRMMFRAFEWDLGIKVVLLYLLQIIMTLPFAILGIVGIVLTFVQTGANESFGATQGIGFLLMAIAVLGLVWLLVRLYLAVGFVIDRKVGPWQAVKLSFQATRSNFWRILAIFLLMSLILLISAIPLFIGWIWTLPMSFVLYGLVYKNLTFNLPSTAPVA